MEKFIGDNFFQKKEAPSIKHERERVIPLGYINFIVSQKEIKKKKKERFSSHAKKM
jgi:hypothetical protein